MKQYKVGILGATGTVGQRFITLLETHPWFSVTAVAASPRSAGKMYAEAVGKRWQSDSSIPPSIANLVVLDVEEEKKRMSQTADFVFSALDLEKTEIKRIEEDYASLDMPVISNNSAHRWTGDVPMLIPEVNAEHIHVIDVQRKNRGWKKGFITVKPNCSIQSYVIILNALNQFEPQDVFVTSLQALSGAGKTFHTWPEMVDNVIPFIAGEEEKSEKEPGKIWASVDVTESEPFTIAPTPVISATCIRVPVLDGHMANVAVRFKRNPQKQDIIQAIENYVSPIHSMNLPSAPKKLIQYLPDENRPQTKIDRDYEHGMGISMGRLQQDTFFDWKFIALSHNTIRGAAGGAILTAELLVKKGYL